jgi:hypothetical protein
VGVEQQVPHAGTPIVPGCYTLEGVVESNSNVGALEVSPAIHVKLADSVHVERRTKRFVQQLDGSDVGVVSEIVAQFVECFEGLLHRVGLGPFGSALELARVVKAILRPWRAVQVKHYFDTVLASPANRLSNVVVCTLYVGSTLPANDGPITNR